MRLPEKVGPAALAILALGLAGAAAYLLLALRGPSPEPDPPAVAAPVAEPGPGPALADAASPPLPAEPTPEPPAPADRPPASAGDAPVHVRRLPEGPPERRLALLAVNEHLMAQRWDEAREAALGVLAREPEDDEVLGEMLEVVVRTSCILADPETARRYHAELPAALRDETRHRCAAHGVELD